MPQYKIGNFVVSPTDDGFQPLLAELYPKHFRPLCMCCEPGLEMYIAKIGEHYIPQSNARHPVAWRNRRSTQLPTGAL